MRYKVGDKIVIRKDLVGGKKYDGLYFNPDMKKFCGKTYTIDKRYTYNDSYEIVGDTHAWNFNDAMIDHNATKALTTTPKFKVGDIVCGTKESDDRYLFTNSDVIKAEIIGVKSNCENDIQIRVLETISGANICEDKNFWLESKYFELVKEVGKTEEVVAPKFKVGDKIRVIKESSHNAPKECTGKVGEIKMIGYSNPEIEVYFGEEIETSNTWYFSEDELEVVGVEESQVMFTKSDLKDRYIVTFRDGTYGMVEGNSVRLIEDGKYLGFDYPLSDTNDMLKDCDDEICDIVSVHKPEYKTIWERTETIKEMSLSDIEKELGYKVKVVK